MGRTGPALLILCLAAGFAVLPGRAPMRAAEPDAGGDLERGVKARAPGSAATWQESRMAANLYVAAKCALQAEAAARGGVVPADAVPACTRAATAAWRDAVQDALGKTTPPPEDAAAQFQRAGDQVSDAFRAILSLAHNSEPRALPLDSPERFAERVAAVQRTYGAYRDAACAWYGELAGKDQAARTLHCQASIESAQATALTALEDWLQAAAPMPNWGVDELRFP